jgi:hypothetical protein
VTNLLEKTKSERETQIKSRNRVRDLAEVYTNEKEVNAMLDLLGPINANITATYLEPTCGNGNFLVEILKRKLNTVFSIRPRPSQRDVEFRMLQAVASIHGIDICQENIEHAHIRMKEVIIRAYTRKLSAWKPIEGFYPALECILQTNIQCGDMLNGIEKIIVTEFTPPKEHHFGRALFRFSDIVRGSDAFRITPRPIERMQAIPYWRLA